MIFLDFSKAETVSHRTLLEKKSSTQLDKDIMLLVSNWLTGQAQRVTVSGVTSDWGPVTSGVLQGSIFCSASTTWKQVIEGMLSKFTDDGKLGGAAGSLEGREALVK